MLLGGDCRWVDSTFDTILDESRYGVPVNGTDEIRLVDYKVPVTEDPRECKPETILTPVLGYVSLACLPCEFAFPPMTYWAQVGQTTPTWVAPCVGGVLRAFACRSNTLRTRGTVFINNVAEAIMWVDGNNSWGDYIPFDVDIQINIGDEIRIAITQADYDHNESVREAGSAAPWYCNMNKFQVTW